GRIVGCCALEVYSKRLAEIRSLAVTRRYQGKGIATKLIETCLELAKKRGAYEVLSITGASKLFKRNGFGTFNKEKYALIKILQ
ncbi:MAG: GNAT family N-acetyltransferase, partial [Candidatus Kaiserbacteria bacterium]|nr:GNAT family N-acetyltransferase [Candidatus Kaiserbacteria bacterium]